MELVELGMLLLPMFLLLGLGTPIFLAMGISSLLFALLYDLPMMILAQSYVRGLHSYAFLAIPFYFLAGDLMNYGGITMRLVGFSQALIGHIRGGLSHVNIITSMIFSGVSGSAVADTSAIGSVLIPSMKKEGYPPAYAAAVTGASSTIGPIIPPSIPLVIYGLLAQVSVGKLFLAGAIPGIMMGVYLLVTSFIISHRRGYPSRLRATLRQLLRSALDACWAIMMPVIILVGITMGITTATEAAVIAVVYGLFLGCIIYRKIKLGDLPRIFGKTILNSGTLLIILGSTGLFSWIIANMGLGEVLIKFFLSISTNKWIILGILNIFFLLWGCVLEVVIAMVILVPMFIPLVQQVGIDLVHFGVVVVINLMIGLITPPIGILIFLPASIAETSVEKVIKEMFPFLIALLVVLLTCTYVPSMVMWLPNLLIK